MNPLFSIIIPHYDIPELLMRCLQSIPVSEDIQVIVVDDNSPSADTYIERYPQLSRPYLEFIRITKGGGAGYARNVGLERARGKWLLFADADDFFVDNMYDILTSNMDNEADIVFFRFKGVLSEDFNIGATQDDYLNDLLDRYIESNDEWSIRTEYCVPWSKMVRRDLVLNHRIHFDKVRYGNDVYFSVLIGYYANSIAADNDVLYYKTSRSGSLTAGFCNKPDELSVRSDVAFRVDRFLLQHNRCKDRYLTAFLKRMLESNRPLYRYYFNNKLDEVYSSRFFAIRDICEGCSRKERKKIILYSLLIWRRNKRTK